LAQQFTTDRAHHYTIYLPNWLGGRNKVMFGLLFMTGELVVLGCWVSARFGTKSRPAGK